MSARIHLNTAGAAIPAPAVPAVMAGYLATEAELGPYEAEAVHALDLDERVYRQVADVVGARPDEIALFGSATDAWCRVVCNLDLPAGSRIWVTPYEYAGNLIALQALASRRGCTLEVVPTVPGGDLDLDWMRAHVDERVGLVSLVHMPSGAGVVQPAEEVGALLAGSAAVYVLDACQTVGQLTVDVRAIGCHLLTGAGRKFLRGPRGSGFAVIARDLWDRVQLPFHDLHVAEVESLHGYRVTADRATRFETAERNSAVVLGLLAAVEHAGSRPAGPAPEVFEALLAAVCETPGTRLLAPGRRRAGIVSFVHERCPPERIRDGLAEDGITGGVGFGAHTPLYLAAGGVTRFVRVSVHHYNDLADIEVFRRSLRRVTGVAGAGTGSADSARDRDTSQSPRSPSMTAESFDPSAPTLVLVGGAGAIPLGEDVAIHALRQGRARGLVTHQTNQAATLAETPVVDDLAHVSWAVDFERPGQCAAWARERATAGQRFDVVIGIREFAQIATAEVAAAVGAPGNPPESVRTVRSKDFCRAALAAGGLPQPAFRLCADRAEAERFIAGSTGPWVVKPRDSMGSEGVRKVAGPAELDAALAALPGPGPFLVEEFVRGKEYSVEGVFLAGEPRVLAVTEKQVLDPPLFVEVGHVLPAPLPGHTRAEFEQRTVAALKLLGLRFGVFHVELWHTAEGVVLGEVHVRNGGDWIHVLLQHAIPGLELFGVVYDDALGRPTDTVPLTPTRAAAVRFLTPPPGVLDHVEGWDAVIGHPAVLRAGLTVQPGAEIKPIRDSHDRVGEIVVGSDTPEQATAIARDLADSVTFVLAGS
jgi:selenocysteine lyase/cysteine desulfurase/biotin carboxylase